MSGSPFLWVSAGRQAVQHRFGPTDKSRRLASNGTRDGYCAITRRSRLRLALGQDGKRPEFVSPERFLHNDHARNRGGSYALLQSGHGGGVVEQAHSDGRQRETSGGTKDPSVTGQYQLEGGPDTRPVHGSDRGHAHGLKLLRDLPSTAVDGHVALVPMQICDVNPGTEHGPRRAEHDGSGLDRRLEGQLELPEHRV
jgi:hypothetical protein